MDFAIDPGLESFRQDVRAFLSAALPADMVQRNRNVYHPSREDAALWTATLAEQGWSAPAWPKEFGGTGWSLPEQIIFADESYRAGAPRPNLQGFSLVGPVIYTYGTRAQRERYLEPIRRGEEFWAQGFSEPGAGSDLAALRTRAERDGDAYVVNGQKIWTSDAHKADMLFCLVRTDFTVKPQKGISFLLIDLKSAGVTVRPIVSIDGGHALNEVFFDNVRVPAENLIGEENMGWTYAKFLLGNERAFSAADLPYCKKTFEQVREMSSSVRATGSALIDDPGFAQRLAIAEIQLMALEYSVFRLISDNAGATMASASVLKVVGSELQQDLSQLLVECLGEYGAVAHTEWHDHRNGYERTVGPASAPGITANYLYRRAVTIFGGSTEIQRNVIAKRILDL